MLLVSVDWSSSGVCVWLGGWLLMWRWSTRVVVDGKGGLRVSVSTCVYICAS